MKSKSNKDMKPSGQRRPKTHAPKPYRLSEKSTNKKLAQKGDNAVRVWLDRRFGALVVPLALLFAALCLTVFFKNNKTIILLLCLLSTALALFSGHGERLRQRISAPMLAMAAYLLVVALSVIWAASGKFFLKEFSKLLFALPLYLFIVLYLARTENAVRKLVLVLVTAATLYALLSVDMATLRLSAPALNLLPSFSLVNTSFELGTRLTGLFGNANIMAGLLGLGIFLATYLLESAETRFQCGYAAVLLALLCYTFLLNFSLGASGFFVVCVLVYFVCAGQRMGSVLLRMLEAALPTFFFVFLSFSFFEKQGAALAVPLLADLCCAGVVLGLELLVYPRLHDRLARHPKLPAILLGSALGLAGVYALCAVLITGASSMPAGSGLRRAAYPEAGTYRLAADYDGSLSLSVTTQNTKEVILHTESFLYTGDADGAAFTVPADSRIIYVNLHTGGGAQVRSVELVSEDGQRTKLPLNYPLLPDFIANRLQGIWANQNAIQRAAFFRDGMKIFRSSPLLGNGLGSFESVICGYQEFHYETRYVHNHYIQVLLDNGLLGISTYAALLLFSLWSLWQGRRKDAPFRTLYPAVCACFGLICLHSTMEVVMSTTIYLPYAFSIFALIALCWGAPVTTRRLPIQLYRWLHVVMALVYTVLFSLNMYAASLVAGATDSYVRFFSALKTAAAIDVFEDADWKISYVESSKDVDMSEYRKQASLYARELVNVPSNSTHAYILSFYLQCQEYDNALLAAQKGVSFNYANADVWNQYFALFARHLYQHPAAGEAIYAAVLSLNDALLAYNQTLLEPIVLNEDSVALLALAQSAQ